MSSFSMPPPQPVPSPETPDNQSPAPPPPDLPALLHEITGLLNELVRLQRRNTHAARPRRTTTARRPRPPRHRDPETAPPPAPPTTTNRLLPTNPPATPHTTMLHPELIEPSDFTIDRLALLLKNAAIPFQRHEDKFLHIEEDSLRAQLVLIEEHHLFVCRTRYGLRSDAPLDQKLALVNRMNDDLIVVRFSVSEEDPDVLIADYFLPYGEGVHAGQVIHSLKLFCAIVKVAVNNCDEDSLVE